MDENIKRFAIVQNGLVVNVAVATLEFGQAQGWILLGDRDPVQSGDSYDGQTFIPAPQPEPDPNA